MGGAAAAADLYVLVSLKKENGAGDAGELAAQAVDHLVGGDAARTLGERLEGNEHAADIEAAAARSAAARKGRHGADGRIVQHHLRQLALLGAHGGEADVLRGAR